MPAQDLNNSISQLQTQIFGINFDISKFYLPDKQIVSNMLQQNAPTLTKKQADQMAGVSGGSKVPVYPISSNHQYFTQAGKIKDDVRVAAAGLIKDQQALIQDLILTAIKISNSIPAITILIAPLSFNAPAAIALLLIIIDAIKLLIDKLMSIVKYLEPLKQTKLLIDPKKFDAYTAPIRVAVVSLMAISGPIVALKSVIDALLGQLKSSTTGALAPGGTQSATFTAPPPTKNGDFDESALASAMATLKSAGPIVSNLQQIAASASPVYVYDAKLPDGSVLHNISDDELESLKEKYKVIFE